MQSERHLCKEGGEVEEEEEDDEEEGVEEKEEMSDMKQSRCN